MKPRLNLRLHLDVLLLKMQTCFLFIVTEICSFTASYKIHWGICMKNGIVSLKVHIFCVYAGKQWFPYLHLLGSYALEDSILFWLHFALFQWLMELILLMVSMDWLEEQPHWHSLQCRLQCFLYVLVSAWTIDPCGVNCNSSLLKMLSVLGWYCSWKFLWWEKLISFLLF